MDVMQGAVVLLSAGVVAAAAVMKDYGRKSMRRVKELHDAAGALTDHFSALEKFVDDPDAPRELSAFLLDFSDAIEDGNVADAMIAKLSPREPRPHISGELGEITRQLDALRLKRRDLVVLFDVAVGSGLTAMFLQSDHNADSFETVSRRFTSDPDYEIVAASKAVSNNRSPSGSSYDVRKPVLAGTW